MAHAPSRGAITLMGGIAKGRKLTNSEQFHFRTCLDLIEENEIATTLRFVSRLTAI